LAFDFVVAFVDSMTPRDFAVLPSRVVRGELLVGGRIPATSALEPDA
jgi:hypothetical protein